MSSADIVSDFARYKALVQSLLHPEPFVPTAESNQAIQIGRACIFRDAITSKDNPNLSAIDRVLEMGTSGKLSSAIVLDRTGHHRPVYPALLIYACLQSFRIQYELLPRSDFGRWEEGLRPWCDHLESVLGDLQFDPGLISAGRGSTLTQAAWTALALHVAGKVYVRDAWTDLASDFFGRLTQSQNTDGTFLSAGSSDNPETWWYHELVLLHAASSYAVQAEDRHVASVVRRNTDFHQSETQPDHATSQPWGLFAFIWNPQTRPLADQLLHSAEAQPDGVSQILLADCLYCLGLFFPPIT